MMLDVFMKSANLYYLYLTEDGDAKAFNQDNFNKSIYKAIEI